ncbi:MAG: putative redox protein [Woeseiaceae bacterium]|jgi:putative redox protein
MSQITAELTSGSEVVLSNGRHSWNADEPVRAGGTDSGPDPYELLLSSLAACTCLTLLMYCRHKGIELKAVRASYDFSNVHADDCADCDESDKGFIQMITSNVYIEGNFDDAQKKRLAQIVSRCPVHKTLTKGVRITDNATFG